MIVHSCNNIAYIQRCLNDAGIYVDAIWDGLGKPICSAYIDDRAVTFRGDWKAAMQEAIVIADGRPIL